MRISRAPIVAGFGLAVCFAGFGIGGCGSGTKETSTTQGGSPSTGGSKGGASGTFTSGGSGGSIGSGGSGGRQGGSTSTGGSKGGASDTSTSGGSGGSMGSVGSGGSGGSQTAGSGGAQTGGASGSSSASSGGSNGGSQATTGGSSGSGGAVLDAAIEGSASSSDGEFFEVLTNFTEFKPKFDPSTVPGIQPLFDGATLKGWNCSKEWSVKEGSLTAGPGFWGFCSPAGTYDKFRWFVSIIQDGTEGDGGHTGIYIDGTPFYGIMTPSCQFWDYAANVGIMANVKCIKLDLAGGVPRTSPDQVYWHGEWFQMEMLVDLTKGTVRAALNGVDYLSHAFKPKSGGAAAPIAIQAHNGGAVRYKDLWIEVDPKEPDKLLSAVK